MLIVNAFWVGEPEGYTLPAYQWVLYAGGGNIDGASVGKIVSPPTTGKEFPSVQDNSGIGSLEVELVESGIVSFGGDGDNGILSPEVTGNKVFCAWLRSPDVSTVCAYAE
jgi:hypothetical protein